MSSDVKNNLKIRDTSDRKSISAALTTDKKAIIKHFHDNKIPGNDFKSVMQRVSVQLEHYLEKSIALENQAAVKERYCLLIESSAGHRRSPRLFSFLENTLLQNYIKYRYELLTDEDKPSCYSMLYAAIQIAIHQFPSKDLSNSIDLTIDDNQEPLIYINKETLLSACCMVFASYGEKFEKRGGHSVKKSSRLPIFETVGGKTYINYAKFYQWYAPFPDSIAALAALDRAIFNYVGKDSFKALDQRILYFQKVQEYFQACFQVGLIASKDSVFEEQMLDLRGSLELEQDYLSHCKSEQHAGVYYRSPQVPDQKKLRPSLTNKQRKKQALYEHVMILDKELMANKYLFGRVMGEVELCHDALPKITVALLDYLNDVHKIFLFPASKKDYRPAALQKALLDPPGRYNSQNVRVCLDVIRFINAFHHDCEDKNKPFAKVPPDYYSKVPENLQKILSGRQLDYDRSTLSKRDNIQEAINKAAPNFAARLQASWRAVALAKTRPRNRREPQKIDSKKQAEDFLKALKSNVAVATVNPVKVKRLLADAQTYKILQKQVLTKTCFLSSEPVSFEQVMSQLGFLDRNFDLFTFSSQQLLLFISSIVPIVRKYLESNEFFGDADRKLMVKAFLAAGQFRHAMECYGASRKYESWDRGKTSFRHVENELLPLLERAFLQADKKDRRQLFFGKKNGFSRLADSSDMKAINLILNFLRRLSPSAVGVDEYFHLLKSVYNFWSLYLLKVKSGYEPFVESQQNTCKNSFESLLLEMQAIPPQVFRDRESIVKRLDSWITNLDETTTLASSLKKNVTSLRRYLDRKVSIRYVASLDERDIFSKSFMLLRAFSNSTTKEAESSVPCIRIRLVNNTNTVFLNEYHKIPENEPLGQKGWKKAGRYCGADMYADLLLRQQKIGGSTPKDFAALNYLLASRSPSRRLRSLLMVFKDSGSQYLKGEEREIYAAELTAASTHLNALKQADSGWHRVMHPGSNATAWAPNFSENCRNLGLWQRQVALMERSPEEFEKAVMHFYDHQYDQKLTDAQRHQINVWVKKTCKPALVEKVHLKSVVMKNKHSNVVSRFFAACWRGVKNLVRSLVQTFYIWKWVEKYLPAATANESLEILRYKNKQDEKVKEVNPAYRKPLVSEARKVSPPKARVANHFSPQEKASEFNISEFLADQQSLTATATAPLKQPVLTPMKRQTREENNDKKETGSDSGGSRPVTPGRKCVPVGPAERNSSGRASVVGGAGMFSVSVSVPVLDSLEDTLVSTVCVR